MRGSRVIDLLLPKRAATIQSLGHPAAGVIGWVDNTQNNTGVTVTVQSALTFSAVWCAVRVIAETIATLPCLLYRRNSEDTRELARDDDRYWLTSDEPHPMISAVTFFESQTAQMVLNGNCYAKIIFANGVPVRLEPRLPETVTIDVSGDALRYTISDPEEVIPAERMLHVAGIGGDGISGWSVVKYAQQSIGAALAGDQYSGGQWGNGATPSGVLTHPMRLDKAAREMIRKEWDDVHKGSANAGKIAIMHGGMEFKPISMTNEDAQFLESREFSIREIARWFRVPPHMLADLADSSVRANIEQQAIEFLTYSLRPWLSRWEQTLNRKLLAKDERRTLYFEFLMESLLRGDSAAQAQAWSVGRQWGWYSVNDVRRMMNLPPVEGGDVYLQPTNMVPAGSDMARGDRPEPSASGGNGVPDTLKQEMQQNLAATINAIITNGQRLREDLESGTAKLAESMAAADANTAQAVGALREVREEIRRDISADRKVQVSGWDDGKSSVVAVCNQLMRRELAISCKLEKAEVTKASKLVARGKNFGQWLHKWYAEFEANLNQRVSGVVACVSRLTEPQDSTAAQWISEYCQRHQEQLLGAAEGERSLFPERVQSILDGWQDDIEKLKLWDETYVA